MTEKQTKPPQTYMQWFMDRFYPLPPDHGEEKIIKRPHLRVVVPFEKPKKRK